MTSGLFLEMKTEDRDRIRGLAESAAKTAAILRPAFRRNPDGSSSEEPLVTEERLKQLRAGFGEKTASRHLRAMAFSWSAAAITPALGCSWTRGQPRGPQDVPL